MLRQAYPSALVAHKRTMPLKLKSLRIPKLPRQKFIIDPLAFAVALFCAPLFVAILGFWALLIPVFAVYFGAIPYLLLGTPVLMIFIPRYGSNPWDIARVAFGALFVSLIVLLGITAFLAEAHVLEMFLYLGMFGAVFAPLWGLAFGYIYNKLQRDFYAQTRL